MIETSRPAWLVRQENASIGEARTRAFLIDRFWILERSVDIEGADFIVQRRLTERSLLDRDPPRLGFVQAKFYQGTTTTQYVHREYVVDAKGKPRADFFLLCHTGSESQTGMYFLTANDIVNHFVETTDEHSLPGRFSLPGSRVLAHSFQVLDARRVLSRMDAELQKADFAANRRFMSWAILQPRSEQHAIDPEYVEELDNTWGDIPRAFNDLRQAAERAYYEIERAADRLNAIIESTDPEKALLAAESLHNDYYSMGRMAVTLPKDLFDDQFLLAVREHKRRYRLLDNAGLLNAHAALRREAMRVFISDVAPKMPVDREIAYVIAIRYEPTSLALHSLDGRLVSSGEIGPSIHADRYGSRETVGVLTSVPGHIEAFVVPAGYSYRELGSAASAPDLRPWSEKIRWVGDELILQVFDRILLMRFPELDD